MTPDEQQICKLLAECNMLPGTWDKRFARNMGAMATTQPDRELTPAAREWIYRLLYKYRRQMPKTYEKHKGNEFCKRKQPRNAT